MTSRRFYQRRTWLVGTALAVCGVAVARGSGLVPDLAVTTRSWLAVSGQVVALGGLFTIAFGVRRGSLQNRNP